MARVARRMGDVPTKSVSVFDIPHPPFGHLPPPGEGKAKINRPYAIALLSRVREQEAVVVQSHSGLELPSGSAGRAYKPGVSES